MPIKPQRSPLQLSSWLLQLHTELKKSRKHANPEWLAHLTSWLRHLSCQPSCFAPFSSWVVASEHKILSNLPREPSWLKRRCRRLNYLDALRAVLVGVVCSSWFGSNSIT